ncbi:WhiB family transcriptional regulator [Streptomyces polyrhachis]|uniref:WhiB family transcriptional regulator n=1 Tax=Streptomyces polyrhachis TaxID=1282885 RepID=A0ABW2GDL9_9ACTN
MPTSPYRPSRVDLAPGEHTDWQTSAACTGLPPSAVFARTEREALPALRACERCPVRARCEEVVAPAENWFDGVSGGRLWRNGRPVQPSSATHAALEVAA